jgi:hypothetical protein
MFSSGLRPRRVSVLRLYGTGLDASRDAAVLAAQGRGALSGRRAASDEAVLIRFNMERRQGKARLRRSPSRRFFRPAGRGLFWWSRDVPEPRGSSDSIPGGRLPPPNAAALGRPRLLTGVGAPSLSEGFPLTQASRSTPPSRKSLSSWRRCSKFFFRAPVTDSRASTADGTTTPVSRRMHRPSSISLFTCRRVVS